MNQLLAFIMARLAEPSTMAGLATLLGVVGIHILPDAWDSIIKTLTAVAGLAAVIMSEGVVAKPATTPAAAPPPATPPAT